MNAPIDSRSPHPGSKAMPQNDRPHILLIAADELRRDALGCCGAEAFETPNIDSIARTGTLFENAYHAHRDPDRPKGGERLRPVLRTTGERT